VETLAEGSEQVVENFKMELVAGSTNSIVTQIEEIVLEPSRSYLTFRIER
jgi:acylphosphatase